MYTHICAKVVLVFIFEIKFLAIPRLDFTKAFTKNRRNDFAATLPIREDVGKFVCEATVGHSPIQESLVVENRKKVRSGRSHIFDGVFRVGYRNVVGAYQQGRRGSIARSCVAVRTGLVDRWLYDEWPNVTCKEQSCRHQNKYGHQ